MAAFDTTTTFRYLVKPKHIPRIAKAIDESVPLRQLLKKRTRKELGVGRSGKVNIPIIYGNNTSFFMSGETDSTPTAKSIDTLEFDITEKYGYGAAAVTHRALKQYEGSPLAMARYTQQVFASLATSVGQDLNIQYALDGSGVLCYTNGAGTGDVSVTVDSPGTRYLRPGLRVMSNRSYGSTETVSGHGISKTASTGFSAEASYDTVKSVGSKTTFTLNTSASWTTNHNVYSYSGWGNAGAAFGGSTEPKNISGLAKIVDSYALASAGTSEFRTIGPTSLPQGNSYLHGLSRNTYSWLNSNIIHNSGTPRDLSLDLMDEAAMKNREANKPGGDPNLMLMDIMTHRKFLGLLRDDKRFVNTTSLDGGWQLLAYSFAGKTLQALPMWSIYPGQIYFINTNDLFILSNGEGWMDEDGKVLDKRAAKPIYDMTYYVYEELVCEAPWAQTVIRDIATS